MFAGVTINDNDNISFKTFSFMNCHELGRDAANITFNLLKTVSGDGITVGPILLGAAKPVHILTPTATVRRLVNMAALASVDAAFQRQA